MHEQAEKKLKIAQQNKLKSKKNGMKHIYTASHNTTVFCLFALSLQS